MLAPGGQLLATVRNVRRLQTVSSLLGGLWPPLDESDEEPLRRFTRRELEKLLFRAGFQTKSLAPAPSPELDQWIRAGRPGRVETSGLHMEGLADEDAQQWRTTDYVARATVSQRPNYGLTSIVILTRNQLPYTKACLESIRFRTDEPYELIVVDNASSDGTVDYLRAQADVKLIENAQNRGFPAGCNQGIRAANGEQVLLLNNDVIVTTGWLARMLEALHRQPRIGLVGPCSNNVSGPQQVAAGYEELCDLDGFAWQWGQRDSSLARDTDRLVGFCLLVRRAVVDDIGLLDERFGLGNFEDDDFCRRAIQAGWRAVNARDAYVHHFGHRSFLASGVDLDALLQRNQQLYRDKWVQSPVSAAPRRQRFPLRRPRPARRLSLSLSHKGGLLLVRDSIQLSLCMIVRDNEAFIEASLASIQPWVDEMVVVDTGSKDRTAKLAERLGARVFHFPWCDDFSAARNESLRRACGQWIFWMDSDDTIDQENGRQLRQLAEADADPSILGYVVQVHCPCHGDDGCDVTVVDHVKLFRNRPDLRFEGRIHEQIIPAILRGRRPGGLERSVCRPLVFRSKPRGPRWEARARPADLEPGAPRQAAAHLRAL